MCQSFPLLPCTALLLLSSSRRAVPLSNPKVERDISRVYRGVEADVPLVPLFERSSGTWARGIFFSDDFRSYMSGNKPLTCGDGCFGIAFDVLTVVL